MEPSQKSKRSDHTSRSSRILSPLSRKQASYSSDSSCSARSSISRHSLSPQMPSYKRKPSYRDERHGNYYTQYASSKWSSSCRKRRRGLDDKFDERKKRHEGGNYRKIHSNRNRSSDRDPYYNQSRYAREKPFLRNGRFSGRGRRSNRVDRPYSPMDEENQIDEHYPHLFLRCCPDYELNGVCVRGNQCEHSHGDNSLAMTTDGLIFERIRPNEFNLIGHYEISSGTFQWFHETNTLETSGSVNLEETITVSGCALNEALLSHTTQQRGSQAANETTTNSMETQNSLQSILQSNGESVYEEEKIQHVSDQITVENFTSAQILAAFSLSQIASQLYSLLNEGKYCATNSQE